jgi:hypothetical protein
VKTGTGGVVVAVIAVLVAASGFLSVGCGGGGGESASEAAISYAIIGDTPYGTAQIKNFPNDVAEINADPQVQLTMHLGDIKDSVSRCSTPYLKSIRSDFDRFDQPLVYTPGDNEWTDCHLAEDGAYWPAGPALNGDTRPARLDEIHRIFFNHPGRTLGRNPLPVTTEGGDYVENVMWSQAGVEFGDLDVPGSNNDWAPWFGKRRTSSQIDEVENRTHADIVWLDRIFNRAREQHAAAVVIGMQADMWDPEFAGDASQFSHFRPIVQELAQQALRFQKPVLLLNGDSHKFVDDKPLADPSRPNKSMYGITQDVPNLRRITVNGDTIPCHEWLKLTIDPKSMGVFSYERERFANQPGFDPATCPQG